MFSSSRCLKNVTSIADLHALARRKVPRNFIDYFEAGSYAEQTLAANRTALDDIHFRQRVLAGANDRELTTTLLGQPVAMPLALAPIGMMGMAFRDGEIEACRAAHAAGIPFTLSTMSICSR